MNRFALRVTLLGCSCFALGLMAGPVCGQKPNIVYIMVDDLGYGSLNSYGASTTHFETPFIDSLATDGMRFTNASTPSAVCSPTRYGVLMGEYPFRSDRKSGVVGMNDKLLPDHNQQTMADWLQGQGYSTAAVGKWHLGFQDQNRSNPTQSSSGGWLNAANDALDPGPRALGFDYYFGKANNHDDRTGAFVENEGFYQLQSQSIDPNPGTSSYGSTYFGLDVPETALEEVTQTLTDKAVDWMDQQADSPDPFFMYFNPIAVHEPTTPSAANAGQSGVGAHGDFIQDMDDSVGQILAKIDDMGIRDNTLVIFTSDNGGHLPGAGDQEENLANQIMIEDTGVGLNGPLKGDKQEIWEGGTRVPFLARLPGTIEAGATSEQMINLVDSWATIMDLVDPTDKAQAGAGADSISFLDALLDADAVDGGRESMITASTQGVLAIRRGDWKYIEGVPALGASAPADEAQPQLYNLATDPGETNDVLTANLTLVAELQAELDAYRSASTSLVIPGDLNNDGVLTSADLSNFVAGWRTDTSQLATIDMIAAGDLDLNGTTDFSDWFLVRAAFNEAGVAIPADFRLGNIPEPGSGALLAILIGIAVTSNRGRRADRRP